MIKIKKLLILIRYIERNFKFFGSSISFLLFLPEMERLFQSSPSTRRNFIDRLIFSHVKNYNSTINKYKKKY